MVYKSKIRAIDEPKASFLEFLSENKYNTPEDRHLLIDALDTSRFLTFSQIQKKTPRFGAGLQDLCDFSKGDVLAIYSPNQVNNE
jgi:4-coumarate--CoA ligase